MWNDSIKVKKKKKGRERKKKKKSRPLYCFWELFLLFLLRLHLVAFAVTREVTQSWNWVCWALDSYSTTTIENGECLKLVSFRLFFSSTLFCVYYLFIYYFLSFFFFFFWGSSTFFWHCSTSRTSVNSGWFT